MEPVTALDTETTLYTDAQPIPRLVSVALASGDRHALVHANRVQLRTLENVFAGIVVMANAPFDVTVLGQAFPDLWPSMLQAYDEGRIHDVLTREKLIDIADGQHFRRGRYGLGDVASRRAGVELDKNDPWRMRYEELLGLEIEFWPADARQYAIMDAVATYQTWEQQQLETSAFERDSDPLADAPRQARAHLALYAQTLRGITTDPELVERLDSLLNDRWTYHTLQLISSGLAKVTGKKKRKLSRNTKVARARVEAYARDNGIELKRSATGLVSLTEDVLESLGLPEDDPLFSYQQFGSVQALRSKNIEPFRAPIVRTRYDECIGTGRTSSSAPSFPWSGTNLQNLPRSVAKALGLSYKQLAQLHSLGQIGWNVSEGEPVNASIGFRECLVPREGHVFVVVDWGMMELVCLGQRQIELFGRSTLGAALRDGRDPHEELGSTIAGFDIRGHEERKKWRTLAKAPNFGYPGGLGAKRFCDFARGTYGIVLSELEARRLKKQWQRQWPEMADYHAWVNALPRDADGRITMQDPVTGFIRGGCTYTEACNFPFQHRAAACAKDAMWALYRALPSLNAHQVLFVHDENVIECPTENVRECVAMVEGIMIQAVARLCPDVPVGVETTVLERYTK